MTSGIQDIMTLNRELPQITPEEMQELPQITSEGKKISLQILKIGLMWKIEISSRN